MSKWIAHGNTKDKICTLQIAIETIRQSTLLQDDNAIKLFVIST